MNIKKKEFLPPVADVIMLEPKQFILGSPSFSLQGLTQDDDYEDSFSD